MTENNGAPPDEGGAREQVQPMSTTTSLLTRSG